MLPRLSPPFDISDISAMFKGCVQKNGIQQFEKAFAKHCGGDYALAFPYCRSAFYSFIKVMGWKGREIILPAYTCASMPATVVASGNIPCFVDIEPDSFNMDLLKVENSIVSNTAVVLASHMYGNTMDMHLLKEKLTPRSHVSIIQDCALALTTKSEKSFLEFQPPAFFSFSIGKHISTGEGGMIVTNDKDLYTSLKLHREKEYYTPGLKSNITRALFVLNSMIGTHSRIYPFVHYLETKTTLLDFLTKPVQKGMIAIPRDMFEKMSSMAGYLGKNQVSKIDSIISRKREIAEQYYKALSKIPFIKIQKPTQKNTHSHFPLLVEKRNEFVLHMELQGIHIGTEVFNYVAPRLKIFKQYATTEYPNSEQVVKQLALLPNYYGMNNHHVQKVIQGVLSWVRY